MAGDHHHLDKEVFDLLKSLEEGDGEGVETSRGRQHALYFGAQWSSKCRKAQEQQVPSLVAHESQSVTWVYVSCDIDEQGFRDFQASFPSCRQGVMQPTQVQVLMRALAVRCLPALVVVDSAKSRVITDATPLSLPPEDAPPPEEEQRNGDNEEASRLFSQAIARSNEGDLQGALCGFDDVLTRLPSHADAAFNLAAVLQMVGHTALAVHYIARFLELRPNDRTAHAILGTVLAESEPEAVIEALRGLARMHPESPWAAHRLACLTGEGASAVSAQPAYVREVFDDLADTFENKLVEHLQYRIPWQLLDAVKSVSSPPPPPSSPPPPSASDSPRWWRAVDLGCGTGLCGKLFAAYTGVQHGVADGGRGMMIGVDLSPKMASIAEQTGSYSEVKVEDVHDTLSRDYDPPLDLILSADTFIYVGKLDHIFTLASKTLAPTTGLFAFSIELYQPEGASQEPPAAGFRLVMSGRYAHTEAYIDRLASAEGFDIVVREDVVVRTEQTRPIAGVVYLLRRKAAEEVGRG